MVSPADIPLTDKGNMNKTDVHDSRSIALTWKKHPLRHLHPLPGTRAFTLPVPAGQARTWDITRAKNRLKGFLTYFGLDYSTILSVDTPTVSITVPMIIALGKLKMGTEILPSGHCWKTWSVSADSCWKLPAGSRPRSSSNTV